MEALAAELNVVGVPIRSATIGKINRKDVRGTDSSKDPFHRLILGFSTTVLPDAQAEIDKSENGLKVICSEIIYHILEQREEWMIEWMIERKEELDAESREQIVYPGRLLFLPDHTFRISKPAVIGVRILGGRIHIGQKLLKDGSVVGQIKSIRRGEETKKEAIQGDEVAIAVDGVTVGRQIDEQDVLLVDVPEKHAKRLAKMSLNATEKEIPEELLQIHRRDDHFWGR